MIRYLTINIASEMICPLAVIISKTKPIGVLDYITINTASEIVCLLIALVALSWVKPLQWRGMIIFMLIICVTELAGIYVHLKYNRNEWLYNLLLPFQAGFISWMFYHLLKTYLPMIWVVAIEVTVLSGLYGYEVQEHGIASYNQLTNTVMLVFISLFSLLYYYFLIRDTHYVNLVKHADFWWVTGIFFFYFGTTACNVFYHQLAPGANDTIKHLTYHIYNAFIFVLYGCWSYSFICKKWELRMSPG